jgi:hypothetical protein
MAKLYSVLALLPALGALRFGSDSEAPAKK